MEPCVFRKDAKRARRGIGQPPRLWKPKVWTQPAVPPPSPMNLLKRKHAPADRFFMIVGGSLPPTNGQYREVTVEIGGKIAGRLPFVITKREGIYPLPDAAVHPRPCPSRPSRRGKAADAVDKALEHRPGADRSASAVRFLLLQTLDCSLVDGLGVSRPRVRGQAAIYICGRLYPRQGSALEWTCISKCASTSAGRTEKLSVGRG